MKRFLVCAVAIVAVLSLGLVLLHCGSGGEEKECTSNADCIENYFCRLTDFTCQPVDCQPYCTGKCCGDDGCEGQCEDKCPDNTHCNTQTCVCDSDTVTCSIDEDCETDECCIGSPLTCEAKDCGARECGPDLVCGFECGPCGTGYHCNLDTYICDEDVTCTVDADCPTPATQCCKSNVCEDMNCTGLECGADPVCTKECGPCVGDDVCNAGVCEPPEQVLCPDTQECVDVTSSGIKGCLLPNTTVPPAAAICSAADPSCAGNFYCVQISQTEFFCIEHCGACPAGQACWTIGGDKRVCLTTEGDIPDGIPYCDDTVECTGNTLCIFNSSTLEYYGCVSLCSNEYGPCTENATKCDGDTVQTCTGGVWVDTTDCTQTTQVCFNGACVTPVGLGEFCDDTACEVGLDCVGSAGTHRFCTPECDCTAGTGCDAGWACFFSDGETPPTCWCGKLCPSEQATECPNGGTNWVCEVVGQDGGVDVYGCTPSTL